ncbi:MAG: ATP-dependent DNA helicase RecG [Flavobacteriales bacterium]|nr:ATP-dependent DNA helicase RecG [Flavobacteriales bacterium]
MEFLKTTIEYLKGVGPQRAETLNKEVRIFTFNDLLHYFPFRYVDRSIVHNIIDVPGIETEVQLKGKITSVKEFGAARKKRLVAVLKDETFSIELIWFKGIKWVKPSLVVGKSYLVFGKANQFGSKWNIAHPDIDLVDAVKLIPGMLQPIYHSGEKLTSKGLNTRGFERIISNLLSVSKGRILESLTHQLIDEFNLVDRDTAFQDIHRPINSSLLKDALFRLKFEELFFLQLAINKQKINTQRKSKGYIFSKVDTFFNQFYNTYLPFELTNAQKRVVKEIRKDLGSGLHMNRLLQGDVGSGKTLVAVLNVLIAIDNGFQSCLMAPTEILATQHFHTVKELLNGLGINVKLLTGSSKKKERSIIHDELINGSISLLIGTHALLEDVVQFKNLGLAIIDEQHRFGVAQRSKLWGKNTFPPHILVMTATPIPRTLAMTFYGDLDVSVIDEMPPGRKEIKTIHRFDTNRLKVFQFIEDEIKKGRQVYIVYPLIEESKTLDYKDLMDGYDSISRRFPLPEYRVSIVHGKMKSADKELEMQKFAKGETQIMVATTVIEVGVNVPNASVMIVESAEKFGLSQLHQLRGRVGRGAEQSYCVLMTSYKLSADARTRMETMVRTNDGFEIAEVDLRMRGPGDIMGTQQSGIIDLKLADLAKDNQLIILARDAAQNILKNDPDLTSQENLIIRKELIRQMKLKPNWSRIS